MLSKRFGNGVLRARLIGPDGDKGEQADLERFGIDLRRVAAQHAAGFQLANALQDR
jgi:hypothetical protein